MTKNTALDRMLFTHQLTYYMKKECLPIYTKSLRRGEYIIKRKLNHKRLKRARAFSIYAVFTRGKKLNEPIPLSTKATLHHVLGVIRIRKHGGISLLRHYFQ